MSRIRLPQIAQSPCRCPPISIWRPSPSTMEHTFLYAHFWHRVALFCCTDCYSIQSAPLKYILDIGIWILTLQSMHLFPYGLMLPFLEPCPGLVYGAAFALALNNLFSPIFRVEEAGWKGSVVANVEVFCAICQQNGLKGRWWRRADGPFHTFCTPSF